MARVGFCDRSRTNCLDSEWADVAAQVRQYAARYVQSGTSPARTARRHGPAPDRRFFRRLERRHQFSRRDQQAILGTIDAFLTKVS
jgi:hypothetical protein